ncbi:hypothetical protein AB1N83_012306 [Pleurotus pulmonarius]
MTEWQFAVCHSPFLAAFCPRALFSPTPRMPDNSAASMTELSIKTRGLPLNNCKTIVEFFKGIYDVLEAHRWAVAEHKFLHRDISHANIVFESKDGFDIQEFNDARRPVFINEILCGDPAPPMTRLLDMDNSANPGASQMKLEGKASEAPLRYRTGTPKFIARSAARGQILSDVYFLPMPTLESDIAAKYKQACGEAEDRLNLRAFSEADESTTHGGHPHQGDMRRFTKDPRFRFDMFKHQPFHDAESVYWCIAAFVLLAKPLNNDIDENQEAFNKMWRCLAEHEVAEENDTRCSLIQDLGWKRWLHQDLSFIADLMAELSSQVKPEWTLLTPAPDPLHLHEAMQRLILQHVHNWEKNKMNVELDTVHSRTFMPIEHKLMAPVSKHPLIGQIIITSSTLGKRGSNSLAGRALPGYKRSCKMGDDETLAVDSAELRQGRIGSQSAPEPPEPLEYAHEDEDEETSW